MKYLFFAALALVFLVELGLSFSWQIQIDGSTLHYIAYLITEHGFVPYRDIFDPNMPGSYLFHMAVGTLFGYSDLAFRLVDVVWLMATLIVTWFVMKPMGRAVAFAGCLLFGLIYLGSGPYMSLQRDFIAILPLATALLLTTRHSPKQSAYRTHFLIGVLFALAALIKPHMLIGLPLMLVYSYIHDTDGTISIKTLIKPCIIGGLWALTGVLATLIIPFLWLWRIGALESFLAILSSYVPLYAQMSRDLEFRTPVARVLNVVYWYIRLGGFGILLASAIFGVNLVLTQATATATKRLAMLLLSLAILFTIYVALGGRFLDYHWMPFVYFASLGTALILYSPPTLARVHRPAILPLCGFIVTAMVVTLLPAYGAANHLLSGKPPAPFHDAQVKEITAYLATHLSPTDTVQPLDWNGGALHAMRITEAVVATPFIFDFQFYHHVSTPYIRQLRKNFLTELEQTMPTFVIDVYKVGDDIPEISGVDTTHEFPALREFIEQQYRKDYVGNGFDIFRKRDD
ncbi:MAG: glycosyltransferase family 39 protein [Caldilineaceae bacterium]